MHYAIRGQTAAELIATCASQPNMGLTTWESRHKTFHLADMFGLHFAVMTDPASFPIPRFFA